MTQLAEMSRTFQPGDEVLLSTPLRALGLCKKLMPLQSPPANLPRELVFSSYYLWHE